MALSFGEKIQTRVTDIGKKMADTAGLEPATNRFVGDCSNPTELRVRKNGNSGRDRTYIIQLCAIRIEAGAITESL